jgi:hypothetical protein
MRHKLIVWHQHLRNTFSVTVQTCCSSSGTLLFFQWFRKGHWFIGETNLLASYILFFVSEQKKTALFCLDLFRSQDTLVGIASGHGPDDRGVEVRVPVGSRIFSSPRRTDRLWGSPNILSIGYRGAFSPGVKRPKREADHSPPASVEVKKMWIYTSTYSHIFMA